MCDITKFSSYDLNANCFIYRQETKPARHQQTTRIMSLPPTVISQWVLRLDWVFIAELPLKYGFLSIKESKEGGLL